MKHFFPFRWAKMFLILIKNISQGRTREVNLAGEDSDLIFTFVPNFVSSLTFCILKKGIQAAVKGSVISYREGGLPKIGEIRYFSLDQKGGSKDFFKLKRGITYIF